MKLTDEQQRVLNGSDGEVRQKMLRLLVQLGRLYDASELVPVKSVQVAGVS
jgi:predicted aconitase